MPLFDDAASLKADLKELEGFLDKAENDRVIKMLSADVEKIREELAKEEAAAAKKEKDAEDAALKKKEAEKQAEEQARKEAEAAAAKKATQQKAFSSNPEGAMTTKGGMNITAEASARMSKIKSGLGRNAPNTAAIMKIGKDGKTFEFEEWLDDCDIEDITDELTELDPKYIFYSYNKTMPDGRLKTPLIFIYYSPQKAPPKKSMEATRWKNEVSKHFEIVKTLEVRDLEDFDQEWFDSLS
eukprot:TRINITY_DN1789_c0_g1_i2.p1 TRINITY_DN1789_c0_g1~~TRINITY_DN1789_c0_g1_i2.p1  ORF type:complete len:256 (+),score=93.22 TRINITY_DN1789_c0_g1_i2:48-770(+)